MVKGCITDFLESCLPVGENFQIWAATLYSSINGSFVKWNWRGSSVERETFIPRWKNWRNGFLSNSAGRRDPSRDCLSQQPERFFLPRKRALLDNGLIAIPIWSR